jgi:hypothetical protein
MSPDDKNLIAWALLSYAEQVEKSPMRHYTPDSTKQTAKRCRELAEHFRPYDWTPTIIKMKRD